jgi:hypothetical protein
MSGMVQQACSAQCSNSTPSNLVGTWRGIEVQIGFIPGEWDYNFTENSVTIRDPMNNIVHGSGMILLKIFHFLPYAVATIGNMVITLIDGPHQGAKINVLTTEMSYGPETLTVAFSLSDYNGPVPDSIEHAFDAKVC